MTDIGWDDEALRVGGEPALVARYRRLQSWYRETHLAAAAGSTDPKVAGWAAAFADRYLDPGRLG